MRLFFRCHLALILMVATGVAVPAQTRAGRHPGVTGRDSAGCYRVTGR